MGSERNFSFSALLMQTHENKHKVKPMQFLCVAEGVKKRLESDIKNKRETRLTHFDSDRNLQKWKEEKAKKKDEALKNKKIPFVVGIPKSSKNFEPPPSISWPLPSTSGSLTRSQAARSNLTSNKETQVNSFAPQNAGFNPSLEGLDTPTLSTYEEKKYETRKKQSANVPNQQPRCLRSKTKLKDETTVKQTQNKSNAEKKTIPKSKRLANQPHKQNAPIKDSITLTAKNPIPKSESRSEEKLRSLKATHVPMTPQQIKEEVKKSKNEGLLDEDVCDMSVEHFQRQLDSEIKRMTDMCEVWDKILEQTTLPDEIQEAVLAAVGQARLLMSQKLQQFASLLQYASQLQPCERPKPGQALVTLTDLQGVWDMVFLQVENVDIRFKKLELSRASGWASVEPLDVVRRPKPSQPKPQQPKPQQPKPSQPKLPQTKPSQPKTAERARPVPNNRLKDFIAAARKAKQANTNTTKTFEAGFFSVQSPVKSPAAATPRPEPSLLKSVLSSEARKASAKKSSYAMMRASLIGKNVDSEDGEVCEADIAPLTPINFGMPPGKSILKLNNSTSSKVAKKLSFKLSNMDTASDSSPTSDVGQNPSESCLEKSPKFSSTRKLERQDAVDVE